MFDKTSKPIQKKQRSINKANYNGETSKLTADSIIKTIEYTEMQIVSEISLFNVYGIYTMYVKDQGDVKLDLIITKLWLKEKLFLVFPSKKEQHKGQKVMLSFNQTLNCNIKEAIFKKNPSLIKSG